MPKTLDVSFTETKRGKKKDEPTVPATVAVQPEPTPPAPTAEELEARRNTLHKSLFGSDLPKEPAAPVVAIAPVEPPPEPPATVVVAPAVAPAPAPAPEPAQPAPASRTEIETAARAAARMVMDEKPVAPAQPPPPSPAPLTFELSPEDKADYEVVQFLERTEPDKHAGAGQRFLDYTKAHYAYQAEWSANNSNAEFDPNSSEHEAWYKRHDPGLDADEIDRGRMTMLAERAALKIVQPQMEAMSREKTEREQREAMNKAMPAVVGYVQQRIVEFVSAVDETLAAHIKDAQGKPLLTEEAIAKIDAADSIAKRVLDDVVRYQLEPMVMALEMTTVEKGGFKLNPAVNPAHRQIADYIDKAEREMLAAPAEVRIQNGKEFATIAQLQRMKKSIEDGGGTREGKEQQIAQLNDRYYTLTVDDIEAIIVEECAQTARTRIDFDDGVAKRKYPQANGNGQPPAQPAHAAPAVPASGKPNSPTVSSSGDTVVQRDRNAPTIKKAGEQMVSVLFK